MIFSIVKFLTARNTEVFIQWSMTRDLITTVCMLDPHVSEFRLKKRKKIMKILFPQQVKTQHAFHQTECLCWLKSEAIIQVPTTFARQLVEI